MTVTAPPRPPMPQELDAVGADALIEEARRRARRRRMCYAALAAVAAAGTFLGLHRGGGGSGGSGSPGSGSSADLAAAAARSFARNGPLTVIDPAGNISTLRDGQPQHRLFRCSVARGCYHVESLAWSPSGRMLAFSVWTGPGQVSAYDGVHVIDVRTGRDRHLIGGSGVTVSDLAWSPDGSRLAYVINIPTPLDRVEIDVVRADGAGYARRLETGRGVPSSPSWSPDGKLIAFASKGRGRSAVYVTELTGARATLVARHATAPAWSPDGSTIAVRGCGGVRLIPTSATHVAPDGLHSASCRPTIRVDGPPTWSPDGRELAVQADGIYVMSATGRQLRLIGTTSEGGVYGVARPAWRPVMTTRPGKGR
jgi:WD40 repeat protein